MRVYTLVICGALLLAAAPLPAAEKPEPLLGFAEGDTLGVLQAKIQHNGYSFRVGHNWVYDMPAEMKAQFYSRRPSRFSAAAVEDNGPVIKHLSDPLPAQFDWRNRGGKSYIGPVRNQGVCGACYAFGACAAAEGAYNWSKALFNESCADFSESFLAWCLGSLPEYVSHFFGCEGADFDYQELQALVDNGICGESSFPYSDAQAQACPNEVWSAQRVRFGGWYRVGCGDIDAVKAAIMNYGVVDAAVAVSSAFEGYAGGVYDDTNTSCDGVPCYYAITDHAIALVGWDDNPPEQGGGCWILRNSWGASWGEGGYMRIRYTAARVACEVAYLADPHMYDPPTPTPTPVPPVTVNIGRRNYFAFSDSMNIYASAGVLQPPCYVFFRIVTPYYGTLYLTSANKLYLSPQPYFKYPITIPVRISNHYLASLRWGFELPGTYWFESGAVNAAAPIDGQGNVNYLNGTYAREIFSLQ